MIGAGWLVQTDELRTIRSTEELSALAADWDGLALRSPGYFLSQTFPWADAAWRTVARPSGHELHCVTLRSEGRLTGIWPLAVYSERGLRKIRPLGFESTGFCAPLVEHQDGSMGRVARLWDDACRAADIVILRHVREDSPLAGLVGSERRWKISDGVEPAPYILRTDYADWAAYQATISAKLRYNVRSARRKLSARGELRLERANAADGAALIDWLLGQKRRWLAHSGLDNDWIGDPACREFLVALLAQEGETGGVSVFSLQLDGVPIAATVVGMDRRRVEGYMTVYDLDWSPYSPGGILTEDVVRWAFERGLDFDFRNGDQHYKYRWARRRVDMANWQVATSLLGTLRIGKRHVGRWVSQARQKLSKERS
jgi:CelD/BcsL family acetyltransferase involved in cellulose biosynthesis